MRAYVPSLRRTTRGAIAFVCFVLLLLSSRRANAATFTVSRTTDADPNGPGQAGELRWAINQANASPEADTITFSVTGAIVLAGPLPLIASDIAISGPGATNLAVDGASKYRIFFVRTGTVSVSGLTLRNGVARGGNGGAGTVGGGGGAGMGGPSSSTTGR